MSANGPEIIGIGEVLWDLLPTGQQLGGAPANFAFHCHQLGHDSAVFSRIGNDELGIVLRQKVLQLGLSDRLIQSDSVHPTGTVAVNVDSRGKPSFVIHEDVAYDYLEWDQALAGVFRGAKAVCFGSLMQRNPKAQATIEQALLEAREARIIFDVNLRQQYYSRSILEKSLAASNWAKLNDDELQILKKLLSLDGNTEVDLIADLRRRFHLELVALTRGERGCLIQEGNEQVELPGEKVIVVDSVGAGDAFTAGLLVMALEGQPLDHAGRFANRLAGRVASSAGATPCIARSSLE